MQSFTDPSDGHEVVMSDRTTGPNFTPGSLEFRTFDGRLPIVMKRKQPHGEADTFFTSLFGPDGSRTVELDWGYGGRHDEAYAHLFRAAPDLYAALRDMIVSVGTLPASDGRIIGLLPLFERAERALSKAEGR